MTIGMALEAALSCDIKGEGVVTPEPPVIEGAGDRRDAPGGDRMLLKGSTWNGIGLLTKAEVLVLYFLSLFVPL